LCEARSVALTARFHEIRDAVVVRGILPVVTRGGFYYSV